MSIRASNANLLVDAPERLDLDTFSGEVDAYVNTFEMRRRKGTRPMADGGGCVPKGVSGHLLAFLRLGIEGTSTELSDNIRELVEGGSVLSSESESDLESRVAIFLLTFLGAG